MRWSISLQYRTLFVVLLAILHCDITRSIKDIWYYIIMLELLV
jgi:hypothetical protein